MAPSTTSWDQIAVAVISERGGGHRMVCPLPPPTFQSRVVLYIVGIEACRGVSSF